MSEITLEKVDIVRERTGVSYAEAKDALENCNGSVVDTLIYLEDKTQNTNKEKIYANKDEFIKWIKELIKKGNVTKIKIKKDDKVLVDVPINAGIAVTGLIYIIYAPLLAIGILTAVVTKVTIEITKADGSIEVVNSIIKNTMSDVKDKFSDMTSEVKDKVNDITDDVKERINNKTKITDADSNIYKYTVKFDEVDNEKDKEESDSKGI